MATAVFSVDLFGNSALIHRLQRREFVSTLLQWNPRLRIFYARESTRFESRIRDHAMERRVWPQGPMIVMTRERHSLSCVLLTGDRCLSTLVDVDLTPTTRLIELRVFLQI